MGVIPETNDNIVNESFVYGEPLRFDFKTGWTIAWDIFMERDSAVLFKKL